MAAGEKLAGGGGRHCAPQESRTPGAGGGAGKKRRRAAAQEGLSAAETHAGDEDVALESGVKAEKDDNFF